MMKPVASSIVVLDSRMNFERSVPLYSIPSPQMEPVKIGRPKGVTTSEYGKIGESTNQIVSNPRHSVKHVRLPS